MKCFCSGLEFLCSWKLTLIEGWGAYLKKKSKIGWGKSCTHIVLSRVTDRIRIQPGGAQFSRRCPFLFMPGNTHKSFYMRHCLGRATPEEFMEAVAEKGGGEGWDPSAPRGAGCLFRRELDWGAVCLAGCGCPVSSLPPEAAASGPDLARRHKPCAFWLLLLLLVPVWSWEAGIQVLVLFYTPLLGDFIFFFFLEKISFPCAGIL